MSANESNALVKRTAAQLRRPRVAAVVAPGVVTAAILGVEPLGHALAGAAHLVGTPLADGGVAGLAVSGAIAGGSTMYLAEGAVGRAVGVATMAGSMAAAGVGLGLLNHDVVDGVGAGALAAVMLPAFTALCLMDVSAEPERAAQVSRIARVSAASVAAGSAAALALGHFTGIHVPDPHLIAASAVGGAVSLVGPQFILHRTRAAIPRPVPSVAE